MTPRILFHFVTLFPETIQIWLTTSILGRARTAGLFDFSLYLLRDFTEDRHRTVDDFAYGGGGGMVLKIEPLVSALEFIWQSVGRQNAKVIYLAPSGRLLNPTLLSELDPGPTPSHLILICGHYEGVDQRFIDHYVDMEVSLGDFVLTGGELPAVALADALIRRLDGALGARTDASTLESFSLKHPAEEGRLLEYPHYTRPAEFRGLRVPEVLLSGNHEKVQEWRNEQSLSRTNEKRPDLLQP